MSSRSLGCLTVILLGLAAYNALGALNAGARYVFLQQLPLNVPVAYLIASHAFWAVGWSGLAWGLWRRRRWARWGVVAGAIAYLGHGWLNRLVLSRSDYVIVTESWALAAGLLGIAVTWWIILSDKHWLVNTEKTES